MILGLKCEACGRADYTDEDGEKRPLEVCKDVVDGRSLCRRCYFNSPMRSSGFKDVRELLDEMQDERQ